MKLSLTLFAYLRLKKGFNCKARKGRKEKNVQFLPVSSTCSLCPTKMPQKRTLFSTKLCLNFQRDRRLWKIEGIFENVVSTTFSSTVRHGIQNSGLVKILTKSVKRELTEGILWSTMGALSGMCPRCYMVTRVSCCLCQGQSIKP